jgi:hypothetical protein
MSPDTPDDAVCRDLTILLQAGADLTRPVAFGDRTFTALHCESAHAPSREWAPPSC